MKIEIETFDVPFEMSKSGYCCRVFIDNEPLAANPKKSVNSKNSWFTDMQSAFDAIYIIFNGV